MLSEWQACVNVCACMQKVVEPQRMDALLSRMHEITCYGSITFDLMFKLAPISSVRMCAMHIPTDTALVRQCILTMSACKRMHGAPCTPHPTPCPHQGLWGSGGGVEGWKERLFMKIHVDKMM